ncbi:MAG TPA: hypothetical protein VHG52_05670 [Thermomicrobiales bacterium]|nr:hypothetical protein [Thermomicrobiales bacterium]
MTGTNQSDTGHHDIERDPTLSGASTRATTGAAPNVDHERQNTQGQTPRPSSGDGMDPGHVKERAGQAADQARDKADQAREKAGQVAHQATDAVDARRGQASDAMDTAATQLRERGQNLPGGERTAEMASMAADKMEMTSEYVREHDVQDMMTDLEKLVRAHPTQSLVAAAAAGFLVGRMLR